MLILGQASTPTHGTVASRVQAFQDVQGLRSPQLVGQVQKASHASEIGIPSGRVRRANTTLTAPLSLPPIEEKGINHYGDSPKGGLGRQKSVTGSTTDKKELNAGLPARPATSFESTSSHQQLKAPILSKQSPERRNTNRRQSSLDTRSATQNGLSQARARLKSIGEGTTGNCVQVPKDMKSSFVRRKTDIHDLQTLIDSAIDEQAKLDIEATSTKSSPRLKSIPSQVDVSTTSPSKRQSIELNSTGITYTSWL